MLLILASKLQITRWIIEEKATALTETMIIFPMMMTLLMGVYDIGQGIVVSQKTIGASQIIADLITRNREVDMTLVNDIIVAGRLALEPYETVTFGYDIASIEFNASGDPIVLWRVTENMDPNEVAVLSSEGLGTTGEGVVVVTAVYTYTPFFSDFLVGDINMSEVAFLRGRRSPLVTCVDCPTI